jgi:hypothetical protein
MVNLLVLLSILIMVLIANFFIIKFKSRNLTLLLLDTVCVAIAQQSDTAKLFSGHGKAI